MICDVALSQTGNPLPSSLCGAEAKAPPLVLSCSRGFTLVEILLVVTIISTLMFVTIPVSYSTYQRYQASASAEKVLSLLLKIRLDSFLYSEENTIVSKGGRLIINDKSADITEGISFQVEEPIRFFRTGATTGGTVKIWVSDYFFVIDIESPFGALTLRSA